MRNVCPQGKTIGGKGRKPHPSGNSYLEGNFKFFGANKTVLSPYSNFNGPIRLNVDLTPKRGLTAQTNITL